MKQECFSKQQWSLPSIFHLLRTLSNFSQLEALKYYPYYTDLHFRRELNKKTMKCACRVISIFWIVLYRFLQRIRYIPLDLCLARGGSANDLDNLSQLLHWAGLFLRGRSTKGMIDARTVLLARFSAPFFVLSRPVWVCFVRDSLSSIILSTIFSHQFHTFMTDHKKVLSALTAVKAEHSNHFSSNHF